MEVVTTDRFSACLTGFTLLPENDGQGFHITKGDPGGGTAWGVTQGTYDVYRGAKRLPHQSVAHMTTEERDQIYLTGYWTEGLPIGVDLMVFDFAVTSGATRSRKLLQQSIGLVGDAVDGLIGPISRGLLTKHHAQDVITDLRVRQLAYYRSLLTFSMFGHGWTNRTNARALASLKAIPAGT